MQIAANILKQKKNRWNFLMNLIFYGKVSSIKKHDNGKNNWKYGNLVIKKVKFEYMLETNTIANNNSCSIFKRTH